MSTTERPRRQGQVLVIFALSLVTLFLLAALAFDAGRVLLQKRDQQNAADAAALAGARYLPEDAAAAKAAARSIATANGFTNGVDDTTVTVNIPPLHGDAAHSTSGFIEVDIASTHPSIFAGIMGVVGWHVADHAVAANQNGVGAGFSMLALDPTGCDALLVSGNGQVKANGNIQVNSECTNGALKRSGGGSITVTAAGAACNVVGDIKDVGSGELLCTQNEGALAAADPLLDLAAPDVPTTTHDVVAVASGGKAIPDACPGGADEATAAAPATCQFTSSYAGTIWRLFPGYYPGGIHLQGGTFYFEPGIYYIAGGGVTINGNGTVSMSVAPGGEAYSEDDGGLMFYNTQDEDFADACAAGTATAVQCIAPIGLAGSEAQVDIRSLNDGSAWDGLVIFQDRRFNMPGDDVILNGADTNTTVAGTIYVPNGDVKVNGNGGSLTTDQVIAYRFQVNGAPGSIIDVQNRSEFVIKFTAAGLVE